MLRGVTEVHFIHLHNRSTDLSNIGEFKPHMILTRTLDKFSCLCSLHSRGNGIVLLLLTACTRFAFVDLLHGLLSLGLGVTRPLELANSLFLLLPSLDLLLELDLFCLLEAVVVTLVGHELQVLNVENFLSHTIEEILVVRYNEQRLLPSLQIVIKPNDSVQIKMIRGFVQHEEGWFDKEGTRKRYSHSPTTREHLGRLDLHIHIETKSKENTSRLGFSRVGSHGGKLLYDFLQTINFCHVFVASVNCLHEGIFFLEQIPSLDISPQHGLDSWSIVSNDFLFDVEEINSRWNLQVVRCNHLE
mmetsp:Transcript_399/g.566  ORF Transcript_399/g.566 Transcript_399/m.566 type:complete len:302 (-) Transcript_399:1440-2345(-)